MLVDHREDGFRLAETRPAIKYPVAVYRHSTDRRILEIIVVARPHALDELRNLYPVIGKEIVDTRPQAKAIRIDPGLVCNSPVYETLGATSRKLDEKCPEPVDRNAEIGICDSTVDRVIVGARSRPPRHPRDDALEITLDVARRLAC